LSEENSWNQVNNWKNHPCLITENENTYAILSCSSAHCPTAVVTLTNKAWLVPVSKLTSGEIPPAFLIAALFGGSLANSPKAPTTFTSTWGTKGNI
jgi:hypothetical protein